MKKNSVSFLFLFVVIQKLYFVAAKQLQGIEMIWSVSFFTRIKAFKVLQARKVKQSCPTNNMHHSSATK